MRIHLKKAEKSHVLTQRLLNSDWWEDKGCSEDLVVHWDAGVENASENISVNINILPRDKQRSWFLY